MKCFNLNKEYTYIPAGARVGAVGDGVGLLGFAVGKNVGMLGRTVGRTEGCIDGFFTGAGVGAVACSASKLAMV